jgi:pimeloyl-ACP methyl ester carboxylesterase
VCSAHECLLSCAWFGPRPDCWKLLAGELVSRGHESIAVDLPVGRPELSASDYAQVIAAALCTEDATVVAHSASGLFLPLVPQFAPVRHLVYLASVLPLPGSSFFSQVQSDPDTYNPEFLRLNPTNFNDAAVKRFLLHDCPPDLLAWARSTIRPLYAKQAITEMTPLKEWPQVLSSYISCTDDLTINPAWWEAAAERRLGIKPIRMDGGHDPFISRPAELADILCDIATQADSRSR